MPPDEKSECEDYVPNVGGQRPCGRGKDVDGITWWCVTRQILVCEWKSIGLQGLPEDPDCTSTPVRPKETSDTLPGWELRRSQASHGSEGVPANTCVGPGGPGTSRGSGRVLEVELV